MDIEQKIVSHAVQDLQTWMAKAPSDTNEAAIIAWQAGYISGVQRALATHEDSEIEEV